MLIITRLFHCLSLDCFADFLCLFHCHVLLWLVGTGAATGRGGRAFSLPHGAGRKGREVGGRHCLARPHKNKLMFSLSLMFYCKKYCV